MADGSIIVPEPSTGPLQGSAQPQTLATRIERALRGTNTAPAMTSFHMDLRDWPILVTHAGSKLLWVRTDRPGWPSPMIQPHSLWPDELAGIEAEIARRMKQKEAA